MVAWWYSHPKWARVVPTESGGLLEAVKATSPSILSWTAGASDFFSPESRGDSELGGAFF